MMDMRIDRMIQPMMMAGPNLPVAGWSERFARYWRVRSVRAAGDGRMP